MILQWRHQYSLRTTILTDKPTTSTHPRNRLLAYRLLFAVAIAVCVLDQATKFWIVHHPELPLNSYWPYGGIEIIPGFFYLAHLTNPGAAWGLFPGFRYGFVLLAFLALYLIFRFRSELELKKTWLQVSFGLLTGGIAGNLIDRILHGHVTDFLDFHLPGYRWPAFNLADSGITIGVTLYIIHSVFFSKPKPEDSDTEVEKAGEGVNS